jgi:hypothetical protein
MRFDVNPRRHGSALLLSMAAVLALGTHGAAAQAPASAKPADPRVGLGAGWYDAKSAASNLRLVSHTDKPTGFVNPAKMGDFGYANSDLAFSGNLVFQGSFNGIQVWDIANPGAPKLRATIVCPGGQGDPSVLGNLLFMSVEEKRGRVDCGSAEIADSVSTDRFRGVRIFDISDIDHPKQVAAVQTCRGSHTHTLVSDPADKANVYVYVSGTSFVRPGAELAGCSGAAPDVDPNTSLFRIDVIKVPLAHPQDAKIVAEPRIFADTSGKIAGLWKGGTHGEGTQNTRLTNQCHDITVYEAIGLAAGACAGNGILLDVSDPANPKRIDEVMDPNFAYWHSATFSNAGDKVVYTDEWGGGTQPRCQATDKPEWGADALFTLTDRKLHPAGYFKIPAAQTATENCVAHNGSLIPVPGRDIMVQAWYQGGVSVFDFTDPSHPKEIAFFDRGPMSDSVLTLGGFWSAYWYNGRIVGSEIGRGLDIFELVPSAYLSKNEIEAAKLVHVDRLNVQQQEKITWPASFVVARAYLDQLTRNEGLLRGWATPISNELARAEKLKGAAQRTALTRLATRLDADAKIAGDSARVSALARAVHDLANASR